MQQSLSQVGVREAARIVQIRQQAVQRRLLPSCSHHHIFIHAGFAACSTRRQSGVRRSRKSVLAIVHVSGTVHGNRGLSDVLNDALALDIHSGTSTLPTSACKKATMSKNTTQGWI
jgi:hypothetical protein